MKRELKFVLNYSGDKRDLKSIKDEYEESKFDGHCCVSFKILKESGEEILPSEFMETTLEEIKEKNYLFKARNFNDKNLCVGDYGILKEKISSEISNFYIIKIREIGELEFAKYNPSISKEVLNYIETNMQNKKDYKAKYIYFDADEDSYFEKTEDFGNGLTGEAIIEKVKRFQGTLIQLTPILTINWDK